MAEIRCIGESVITIDPNDSMTVIARGINDPPHGEQVRAMLSVHRLIEIEGLVLSPGSGWLTVYKFDHRLWIVRGKREEDIIKILTTGPDEEKSELVLERLCHLSTFGDLPF